MQKKPIDEKFVIMQTYLKPASLETLNVWSKKMRISRAELVRIALKEFIDKYHDKMESDNDRN